MKNYLTTFVLLGLCASLAACASSSGRTRAAAAPPPAAVKNTSGYPPQVTAQRGGTATVGPVTASNPSTAIVDINRSTPAVLGRNSPPPSSFENSCAPPPYLFQSKAGYEAVRVKDCRNDQLVYLPSSAQAQIDIYVSDCQARCGSR